MFETISPSYLFALGILLIGLEAITFSFILFFFGLGFVIVAFISLFYTFENATVQVAVAFVLALILAYLLRNKFLDSITKKSENIEEKTHVSGIGTIEDGMVKFDGTYWESVDDVSLYKEGERVQVIDVVGNKVKLG